MPRVSGYKPNTARRTVDQMIVVAGTVSDAAPQFMRAFKDDQMQRPGAGLDQLERRHCAGKAAADDGNALT